MSHFRIVQSTDRVGRQLRRACCPSRPSPLRVGRCCYCGCVLSCAVDGVGGICAETSSAVASPCCRRFGNDVSQFVRRIPSIGWPVKHFCQCSFRTLAMIAGSVVTSAVSVCIAPIDVVVPGNVRFSLVKTCSLSTRYCAEFWSERDCRSRANSLAIAFFASWCACSLKAGIVGCSRAFGSSAGMNLARSGYAHTQRRILVIFTSSAALTNDIVQPSWSSASAASAIKPSRCIDKVTCRIDRLSKISRLAGFSDLGSLVIVS